MLLYRFCQFYNRDFTFGLALFMSRSFDAYPFDAGKKSI